VSDAGVYVAQEQGYFAEAGVVAEDTTIDASTTIQALATGQLDVGGGAVSAGFFNAFGRGAIVRIVADKGSLPPGHGYQGLIVRQDLYAGGQLRQPADLRGRRVALTARGITTEIAVARVAERCRSSRT
jgi:NitT/TauT family transport system substrate-binding protein